MAEQQQQTAAAQEFRKNARQLLKLESRRELKHEAAESRTR